MSLDISFIHTYMHKRYISIYLSIKLFILKYILYYFFPIVAIIFTFKSCISL